MITLRKHQQEVLPLATGRNYALFWGCGAGKTLMGLSIYLQNKKIVPGLKLLVIVSPKELIQSAWASDCEKIGLHDYKSLKDIKSGCPDIVLTNYESATLSSTATLWYWAISKRRFVRRAALRREETSLWRPRPTTIA